MAASSTSSAMTLGEAIVEIGGDLTKLEAAFAEARRMRDQFDADMVASSGGLLKFTKAANDAGDAASVGTKKTGDLGDASKTAAEGIDKLTAAQTKSVEASAAASAALETEAEKTARLSAMVDMSIAKMAERNRVAAASTNSLIGSSVPKEPGLLEAQNALMGVGAAGKINLGVNPAEVKAAEEGVKAVTKEVENLGSSAVLSSSAIRELIILIREFARGDFTRMAGSASILAQRLGAIEAIGAPLLFGFAAIATAVGVVGAAFVKGSAEAARFENQLRLTGDLAGLTAGTYEQMAKKIGEVTNTSISSNKAMIAELQKTNDFSSAEIEMLVTGAQKYAKATGESAESVIKDFEKMAESPTKYAESYQHAHIGVITPIMMQHIEHLERTGDKEGALRDLIKIVMDDIANKTVEDVGIIVKAWNSATKAVSDFWEGLKQIGTKVSVEGQIDGLNKEIEMMGKTLDRSSASQMAFYNNLVRTRDGFVATKKAADDNTKAAADAAKATDLQDKALKEIHDTRVRGVDSMVRYNEAVEAENTKLANALKMPKDTPIATLLAQAARSAIPDIKEFADTYSARLKEIKKENLPATFKAEEKAARDAAAALKKLENAAAALEKRRQEAITSASNEVATLQAVLPLYQDHTMTLDQLNRAKEITIKLSQLKLSADSAEGKQIAALVGTLHDMNKAISDSTKEWADLEAMEAKTDSIRLQTSLLGMYGEELVYETLLQEKMNEAIKQHRILTDEDVLAIDRAAKAQAKAQGDQDKAKFAIDYKGGGIKQPTGADMRAVDQLTGGKAKMADDLKTVKTAMDQQQAALDAAYDISLRKDKEYLDKKAAIEAKAAHDSQIARDAEFNLRMDQATLIATNLETITASAFGKQSAAYKVAFTLEKEFTIAKAALALERAIAEASSLPWPTNIPAIIQATAEGAQIASAISQIVLNLAEGGMIHGPGSGTSDSIPINASDGEFMVNAQSTVKFRPQLEDINAGRMPTMPGAAGGGSPRITINNMAPGVAHDVRPGLTINDVVITAKMVVAREAPGAVAADLRSPNSRTSKAIQANTTATRRRK